MSFITGKVLIDHIVEIFSRFGLTEDEVKDHVIILSDRGANIKFGLINHNFIRLTCYAHVIHNLVTHMLGDPNIAASIKNASKLSSYFKNSGLNKSIKKSLKRFTPTRWNSVYIMLDAIIDGYQEIYDVLVVKQRLMNEVRSKRKLNPDNSLTEMLMVLNLSHITDIRNFLKPFKVYYLKIFTEKFSLKMFL